MLPLIILANKSLDTVQIDKRGRPHSFFYPRSESTGHGFGDSDGDGEEHDIVGDGDLTPAGRVRVDGDGC